MFDTRIYKNEKERRREMKKSTKVSLNISSRTTSAAAKIKTKEVTAQSPTIAVDKKDTFKFLDSMLKKNMGYG